MSLLTTLIVIGLVGWGWTRPILPLPYQLVYLSPDPYGYHLAAPPQPQPAPILTNRVSEDDAPTGPEEVDKSYEVTQFHTEDNAGRIVFGFHSPDQIRMESREPDGTVRGSYSYVDAYGNVVKMQYWDEGNGIHMAGNNLPVALHQEPEYTPEVRAAREEHFRLYEAALATLRAAGLDDSPEQEPERYPSGEYDEDSNTQSSEEVQEEEAPPADDTVIVENAQGAREPSQDDARPSLTFSYNRPMNLPEPDNDDEESIAIENPELFRTTWDRKGKSSSRSASQRKSPSMDASASQVESRAMKPEEPTEEKATQKKVAEPKPTEKKEPTKGVEAQLKSLTREQVEDVPQARAFYYQFAHQVPHQVPQPVERIDEDITQTEEIKQESSAPAAASPQESAPSAPASQETAPAQIVSEDSAPQIVAEETAAQIVSKETTASQEAISARALDLGAIPVAAVHDAQVSPRQRSFLPSYHLRPIYIPPILN